MQFNHRCDVDGNLACGAQSPMIVELRIVLLCFPLLFPTMKSEVLQMIADISYLNSLFTPKGTVNLWWYFEFLTKSAAKLPMFV